MYISKKHLFIATLLLLVGILAGCDLSSTGSTDPQQSGQQFNDDAYNRLSQAEPPLTMSDSLARKEINDRYRVFNNKTGFGYFYAFVPGTAQPVVEYVVKGGVFPVDDAITPPQKVEPCPGQGSQCGVVVPSSQPDGTFNTNGPGMFGFTADGTYFEWSGIYAYSTHPLAFRPLVVKGCTQTAEC